MRCLSASVQCHYKAPRFKEIPVNTHLPQSLTGNIYYSTVGTSLAKKCVCVCHLQDLGKNCTKTSRATDPSGVQKHSLRKMSDANLDMLLDPVQVQHSIATSADLSTPEHKNG